MAVDNAAIIGQASAALIALVDKKIRKYHKKLRGVDAHKESLAKGATLTAEQQTMLNNEEVYKEMLDELSQLKAGFVADKLDFTVPEPVIPEPETIIEIKKKKVTKGEQAQRAALFGYLVANGFISEHESAQPLYAKANLSATERQLLIAYVQWVLKQKTSNADRMAFFQKEVEKVSSKSEATVEGFTSNGPVQYCYIWELAEKLGKAVNLKEDAEGFIEPKKQEKKEEKAAPGKKAPGKGPAQPKAMPPMLPPSPAGAQPKSKPSMAPPVMDLGENRVLPKAKPPVLQEGKTEPAHKKPAFAAPGAPSTKPPVNDTFPTGLSLPPPTMSAPPVLVNSDSEEEEKWEEPKWEESKWEQPKWEEPKSKKPEPDADGFMTVKKRGGARANQNNSNAWNAQPAEPVHSKPAAKSVWANPKTWEDESW